MTVCVDGNAGLPADENFRDKLDELRALGCRLSQVYRLAIDDNVPKQVLALLIHVCHIYVYKINGSTDSVIELPRHIIFYKKMLGFRDLAERRICSRVGVPVALLGVKNGYMAQQIEKFSGLVKQHGGEKSLYPCFLSSKKEAEIETNLINRLQTGVVSFPVKETVHK